MIIMRPALPQKGNAGFFLRNYPNIKAYAKNRNTLWKKT